MADIKMLGKVASRLDAFERKISELEASTEEFTQNPAQRDEDKNMK